MPTKQSPHGEFGGLLRKKTFAMTGWLSRYSTVTNFIFQWGCVVFCPTNSMAEWTF